MGLFKKLQNGDTRLTSLKFGNDRPNGGSSKQPYIKKGLINDTLNPSLYNDFVLRGGILAPLSAAEDVTRLTKYFTDIQNPSGLLFTAKQNLLSKSGTKTEASVGKGYGDGTINEGIYTPISTLGQSLVGFTGTHLNKQGIDLTGLSIVTYQDVIKDRQLDIDPDFSKKNNRLISLTDTIIFKDPNINSDINLEGVKDYKLNPLDDTLISYSGGAGSTLGFGKTNIKFGTNNNQIPVKSLLNSSTYSGTETSKFSTWDSKQFSSISGFNLEAKTKNDFREKLISKETQTFIAATANYSNDFEKRFNLTGETGFSAGSPRRNRSNYTKTTTPLDSINAFPIYKSESSKSPTFGSSTNDLLNDIIPFSIAILNNDDQNKRNKNNGAFLSSYSFKKFMHFRAFIDSFSDSYDANWKSLNYMGRAEKLYKYSGFDRKISMAFTVAAQSKEEINVMYDKLNFLASSLAPEYIDSLTSGYMAGNIAYITLGDYIIDQPGIITSLTFDIPEESPWEIENDGLGDKSTTRRLPHMIKVTGFNFTPIHKFRPSKQTWKNDFDGDGKGIVDSTRLSSPGNQKFIDTGFKFDPKNFAYKKENAIELQFNPEINDTKTTPIINDAEYDKGTEIPITPPAFQNTLIFP
jgi:hypothetical protein